MMTVKITGNDAIEIRDRLSILIDSVDLLEEYSVDKEIIEEVRKSCPRNGGLWEIPSSLEEAICEELLAHADILLACGKSARSAGDTGQSLACSRQAKKFQKLFKI